MRIPLLSAWLAARDFDRNHRPFLTPRPFPPVEVGPGRWFSSGLNGVWCSRHDCWFRECPQ